MERELFKPTLLKVQSVAYFEHLPSPTIKTDDRPIMNEQKLMNGAIKILLLLLLFYLVTLGNDLDTKFPRVGL